MRIRQLSYENGRFKYGMLFIGAAYDAHDEYLTAKLWCVEQFGDHYKNALWSESSGLFWFYREVDAFAFKLRWA